MKLYFVFGIISLLFCPLVSKADFTDQFKVIGSDIRKLKEDMDKEGVGITDLAQEIASNVSDLFIKETEELLNEFRNYFVEFNKAGFRVDEVWIDLGKPPVVTALFKDVGSTVDEEEFLAKYKENDILYPTFKGLFATRKFNIVGYRIKSIRVKFLKPPKIVLQTKFDETFLEDDTKLD